MDFDVTREQWVERFAMRLSALLAGEAPDTFHPVGDKLWQTHGQLLPEAAAEAEAASRRGPSDADDRFERTERIPVERLEAAGEYVRDDAEWIARCVDRVLTLDPIIKAEEARRSVTDLAALERWRLMKPEAAADQLYTPIRSRGE